ncbi:MAG: thiamine phosphate synthase [Solirubrobacteraceae bacterium]
MNRTAHERLASACLYLICDQLPEPRLRAALSGGVDLVQLRMKSADDRLILDTAQRYAAACAEYGAMLIINDRPDLAARAGADGAHVGQDDMPVTQARALVGPDLIVGLSTHTAAQIDAANASDVDYIGVGPIYSTPTKPEQAGVGITLVQYAAEHAHKPFFAIGGIDTGNVEAVVAAGARGIAVVRALTEVADPELAAHALRSALPFG